MDPAAKPIDQALTNPEDFRQYIEVEVLIIIKDLSEKGTSTQEHIQEIAKLVLERIKPGMTIEELYLSSVKLDDNFSELAPLVFKIMKFYEDHYEKKALDEVSQMIRSGKFDDAQDMVKKVLMFKVAN